MKRICSERIIIVINIHSKTYLHIIENAKKTSFVFFVISLCGLYCQLRKPENTEKSLLKHTSTHQTEYRQFSTVGRLQMRTKIVYHTPLRSEPKTQIKSSSGCGHLDTVYGIIRIHTEVSV